MTPRIGIFGGTFDPIHVGHLVAAVNTRHDLEFDRVVMMVANIPWQKAGERKVSPAEDRFEMVRAAVGDVAGLEASRMEIDRGGPSYTADTVSQYAALYPGAELFVIVGWDVGADLQSWERLDEVRDMASLVVVNRPGTPPPGRSAPARLAPFPGDRTQPRDIEHRPCAGRHRPTAGLSGPRPRGSRHQGAQPVLCEWMTTALGAGPSPPFTHPRGTSMGSVSASGRGRKCWRSWCCSLLSQ